MTASILIEVQKYRRIPEGCINCTGPCFGSGKELGLDHTRCLEYPGSDLGGHPGGGPGGHRIVRLDLCRMISRR